MEKLFYQDIHITDFEAQVTACTFDEQRGLYKILLNRTAFFPEEGGQTADKGTLTASKGEPAEAQPLEDVTIEKDLIYHYTKSPFPAGAAVRGHVDWKQRFDFMQQHTGEHILSGLVHKHYGYDNVGFHLGLSGVTLDFNGPLSQEQLRDLEGEANTAVWENLPVQITFPSPDVLQKIDYRSKLELTENVRIVEIPGIDVCACCAPHVESTGQIGLIKITNVQSHRGGVRVNILCGGRALNDYTKKQDTVSAVSVLLSAKQDAAAEAVKRLMLENTEHKERANALQADLLAQKTALLPSPEKSANALLFAGSLDNIAMRSAVNALALKYSGFCGIFAKDGDSLYRFVIGSREKNCTELASLLRQRFQAKGGGSASMIQGSLEASEEALRSFICQQT